MNNQFTLHHGDCLESMRGMADNSVDSVVCDPPYLIGFMGRDWDHKDGIAGKPEVWRECLRVLKPGGHLLSFAGARTYHRIACAIEDAGFEIRDQIMYIFGSGFPKSLDVSKAIDKAGGASPVEQSAMLRERREAAGMTREQVAELVGCTQSSVRDWEEGRARATGSAIEYIVPSAAYRAKLADVLGYSSDERRLIGAADDRREDGTVYGIGHSGELRTGGHTEAARKWAGFGTALKPAHEPICVARKPLIGTVAANVLQWGTGAVNIDKCRIATNGEVTGGSGAPKVATNALGDFAGNCGNVTPAMGRWPANLILENCPEVVAGFPISNGSGPARTLKRGQRDGEGWGMADEPGALRDAGTGSAARFFYSAKVSKSERNAGLPEGMVNTHPTLKPLSLMAYIARLVTPPGGTVLDPFMGSGSTGVACLREGFRFIGCELDPEYIAIARARIQHEVDKIESARVLADAAAAPAPQFDLFAS